MNYSHATVHVLPADVVNNWGILMLVALISTIAHKGAFAAEATSTYCVSPDRTTYQNQTCYTFSHYVTNVSQYFTWSTTLLFLPGTHTFQAGELVVIENVETVNFVGIKLLNNDSVRIDCNHTIYAGIAFTNITTVNMVNLTIANCGAYYCVGVCAMGHHFVYMAALVASNVESFLVQDTVVENSTKIGVVGVSVTQLSIANSTFVGNNLNEDCRSVVTSYCSLVVSNCHFFTSGHALEVENSTLCVDNSWVIGNNHGINVKNGNASFHGLRMIGLGNDGPLTNNNDYSSGMRCTNSSLYLYDSSCTEYALCITASTCTLNVSSCIFENNSDAIATYDGSKTLAVDTTFIQNTGFSQFHQDSIAILKNTTFYNNQRSSIFCL